MTAEKIGRYQISVELGRGAMGVVYRAIDPAIGRTVAIKTIRLSSNSPEDRQHHVERLRREAQSAGRLSHPHIVTVYDFIESGDAAYVCLEFIEGPSLETVLTQRKQLVPEDVVRILRQAAEALDYAHSKGVVHRDVKPGNILLSGGRDAKITDFGIATMVSDDATLTGPILGTPNYMSPEQVQSRPVGGRSDQFSLAVIAYEVLTGEKPFNGYSMASIVYKVCNEAPVPPSSINNTLSPAVDAVFSRALAKDPAMRFANIMQFAANLEHALNTSPGWRAQPRGAALLGSQTSTPEPPIPVASPIPKRRKRRAGLTAILSAFAGFAAVALVFWFLRPRSEPVAVAEPPVQAPPALSTPAPSPAVEEIKPAPVEEAKVPETTPQQQTTTPQQEKAKSDLPEEPKTASRREPLPDLAAHDFRIETVPDGATIQIDNIPSFTCVSPCSLTLAAGRHTLKVDRTGYRLALKVVEVPTESTTRIPLEMKTGTVMVRSNPPGATVYVDGKEWASKTPVMMTLPSGKHLLQFTKEGYRAEESSVDVRDGGVMNLDINWINQ